MREAQALVEGKRFLDGLHGLEKIAVLFVLLGFLIQEESAIPDVGGFRRIRAGRDEEGSEKGEEDQPARLHAARIAIFGSAINAEPAALGLGWIFRAGDRSLGRPT